MGTILLKTQVVLDSKYFEGDHIIGFAVADPEDGTRFMVLHMERARWEDLGSPEAVTVTIQPGNTLEEGNNNEV